MFHVHFHYSLFVKLLFFIEGEYINIVEKNYKMIQNGSGGIEIKSGYGLTYESELKILSVIKKLKDNLPIEIKSTFLGAHAYPKEITKKEYLNLILNKMIPDFTNKNL